MQRYTKHLWPRAPRPGREQHCHRGAGGALERPEIPTVGHLGRAQLPQHLAQHIPPVSSGVVPAAARRAARGTKHTYERAQTRPVPGATCERAGSRHWQHGRAEADSPRRSCRGPTSRCTRGPAASRARTRRTCLRRAQQPEHALAWSAAAAGRDGCAKGTAEAGGALAAAPDNARPAAWNGAREARSNQPSTCSTSSLGTQSAAGRAKGAVQRGQHARRQHPRHAHILRTPRQVSLSQTLPGQPQPNPARSASAKPRQVSLSQTPPGQPQPNPARSASAKARQVRLSQTGSILPLRSCISRRCQVCHRQHSPFRATLCARHVAAQNPARLALRLRQPCGALPGSRTAMHAPPSRASRMLALFRSRCTICAPRTLVSLFESGAVAERSQRSRGACCTCASDAACTSGCALASKRRHELFLNPLLNLPKYRRW